MRRITCAGSAEQFVRVGNELQRIRANIADPRGNDFTGAISQSSLPSRCHALRPGAEKTVTFVLGPLGARPHFFPALAYPVSDWKSPHSARATVGSQDSSQRIAGNAFGDAAQQARADIQDIVMGKSLPIAAGIHPLSPGKPGT
jgi:hypothetical protein